MCSLQFSSDVNFGAFPSEQLEDDFITNLFSQNINCPGTSTFQTNYTKQNAVLTTDSTRLFANQMDHNYAASESSTLLSPACEETTNVKASPTSLNMSSYFSSFDPSVQFQTTQQQFPVMQNKLTSIQQAMGKIHRACINLVPTPTGTFKAVLKRKRKRTVFRTDQVEAMEEVFAKKPYVTKEDRKALVERLQISDKSVKVWFQNRRLKIKRGEDHSIPVDENRSSPGIDRLDYVESKIYERTNEFGYVTLDDRIMTDLVTVIDDYLNKPKTDLTAHHSFKMEVADSDVEIKNVPVYEPISPASTADYSNEESSWEYRSPVENEYFERLIDIESIISQ